MIIWLLGPILQWLLWCCIGWLGCIHRCCVKVFVPAFEISKATMFRFATAGQCYQPVVLPKSYTVKVLNCLRTSWNHKSLIKCDGDFNIRLAMVGIVWLVEPVLWQSLRLCFGKLGRLHYCAKKASKYTTVVRKTLIFLWNTAGHCRPVTPFYYCQ